MSEVVIKVENLSKKYTIRHQQRESYTALRDVLTNKARMVGNRVRSALSSLRPAPGSLPSALSPSREDFWALKDVSFEVKQGEVVGIIGRNGAGKSTLLKILSRITEPTTGSVKIKGRVASLLEVGTGFHPELTGRENIYLNGAILGMTKTEIKKKFDEIVAFAEIEKFLDTPVKRYSSGMYVRLAFAVAAHLEPEILLVDEVLAVGDAQFQKKCLGKMKDVSARKGRTVLFVSHNMGAVKSLCLRSILLQDGHNILDGNTQEVIKHCQSPNLIVQAKWQRGEPVKQDIDFAFLSIIIGHDSHSNGIFSVKKPIPVQICYIINIPLSGCQIGIRLYNSEGIIIFTTSDSDCSGFSALQRTPGLYRASFAIPENFLSEGTHYVLASAHLPGRHTYETIEKAVVFEVDNSDSLKSLDGRLGLVAPLIPWSTCKKHL